MSRSMILYILRSCAEKSVTKCYYVAEVAVIDILHENPKFEIVNRYFSKLACTPSFESHVTDNKKN